VPLKNESHGGDISMRGVGTIAIPMAERRMSVWWLMLVVIAAIFICAPVSLKGNAQLLLSPLVILIFSRLKFLGSKIPPAILLFAVCGVIVGGIWEFYHVAVAPGAFVVSTVSDGDMRQEAKIYRDRLRKSAGMTGESVIGLHPSVVKDAKSARGIVDSGKNLGGVIWGGPRWMSVTLKKYEPLALSEFPPGSIGRQILSGSKLPELLISRTVPEVGMSDGYAGSTVFFLARIAQIWRLVPRLTAFGAYSDDYEGRLESLGRIRARWTSQTHTALPLWLTGTLQLIRAIESSDLNTAYIDCAITNFSDGLEAVLTRDNPALEMSIRNNYAVALLARAELGIEAAESANMAGRQLSSAMELRKADVDIGNIVAQNYYGLAPKRGRERR